MFRFKNFPIAAILVVFVFVSFVGYSHGNGDDHEPGCPEEALPAEGSFSVDEDEWYPFFYGRVRLSNLTYWPRTVEEPSWAHISSDHHTYAHHYYEDRSFTVYYAYRLAAIDQGWKYESNKRYASKVDEYDPEDAMPTPLDHSETLWVNVTDLPIPRGKNGKEYFMSAYTRMDVYFRRRGRTIQFSLKDCQNRVRFWHTRVPED